MILPPGVDLAEVLAIAQKTSDGVDKVMASLETWTPEEMVVLFAGMLRSIVDVHPETRELVLSQLGLALHKIETEGRDGN